jgi:hypothetical protein
MKSVASQKFDQIINEFVLEATVDYVGLWEIAKITREELGADTTQEVRELSLQVAKGLYEKGLRPGDYDYGKHIDFWPDQGCRAMLDRIEREWIKLNADPTHLDPICSFLRPET